MTNRSGKASNVQDRRSSQVIYCRHEFIPAASSSRFHFPERLPTELPSSRDLRTARFQFRFYGIRKVSMNALFATPHFLAVRPEVRQPCATRLGMTRPLRLYDKP